MIQYDPAGIYTPPSGKCQPGAVNLRNACLRWSTSFRDLGCYNDRNIRGSTTPSLHREGRAFDIGINTISPLSKAEMDDMVNTLVRVADIVYMQQVIWYRRVWTTGIGWRDFDGSAGPHTDHAHIEINWDGAENLDAQTALVALYGPGMEDEIMTRDDYEGIAKAIIEYPIETTYDVGTPNQRQVKSNIGAILANIGIQVDRLVANSGA